MKSKPLLFALIALASVVYFAGLVHYAQVRPVDADEGYYTTAARLVWEGKTPYRDFSYPQAPLLPYIYSWIWAIRPRSLVSMRLLSAAFGGTAVFLWGVCLLSVKRLPTKVALATFVAVLLNPYWVSWNVVVKTFAVANLLMSIATICFYAALHSERAKWYFMGGLALGACASTRGLYGPLIPSVLVWLFYREWRTSKSPYPKTLTFLAGAICGLLPIIFSFVRDPQEFIFNNVLYHSLLQSRVSFRHNIHMYLYVIIGLSGALYFIAGLLVAVVGGLSLLKLRKRREGPYIDPDYLYFELAFLMFVVYTVTALTPFPVWAQYFDSPLLPFLVPFLAEGLRVTFRSGRKWVVVLAVMAPILFIRDINREVMQISSATALQLSSYRKVAQAIEANSNTEDIVLSFWPGYVFESGRRYFPGWENKFNYPLSSHISPEVRARYHIVSKGDVISALSTGSVNMLVTLQGARLSDDFDSDLSPRELQAFRTAVNANYSLVDRIDDLEVYRRR